MVPRRPGRTFENPITTNISYDIAQIKAHKCIKGDLRRDYDWFI